MDQQEKLRMLREARNHLGAAAAGLDWSDEVEIGQEVRALRQEVNVLIAKLEEGE